jgi:error-prone DNA polymerase
VAARATRPLTSVADLVARTGVSAEEAQTLAAIGALAALGGTRRSDLWAGGRALAGTALRHRVERVPSPTPAGPLRDMTTSETLAADYAGTGVTLGPHPMALRRAALARAGVVRAADLVTVAMAPPCAWPAA